MEGGFEAFDIYNLYDNLSTGISLRAARQKMKF